MKILVVDDSVLERKLIIGILKKAGIANEMLEAVDGEDALNVLGRNYKDICLILLDWQMPKLSGIEFMQGVIKVPATASIPIVMVTASGSEECQRQAREVNPKLAGYVVKPIKVEKLLEAVTPHVK